MLLRVFIGVFLVCAQSWAQELLLYYANETSLEADSTANHKQLVQWLNELPQIPTASRIASQLEDDRARFSRSVDKEVGSLSRARSSVVVFTNALARRGRFLSKNSDGTFKETRFSSSFASTNDPIFQINPLSNPENLTRVLAWLQGELEKSRSVSQVGLVFNSHGSVEMAVTPRIAIWTKEWTREKVAKVLKGEAHERKGIARAFFFKTVTDFANRIHVPLKFVYLQSCGASPAIRGYPLGNNVESFFTGANGVVKYEAINYDDILRDESGAAVSALQRALRTNSQIVEYRRISTASFYGDKLIYLAPLILVLAYAAFLRFRLGTRSKRA